MQCPQCQFENMPGLDRCFKCGSVLAEQGQIDVHPPRMPAWKKPWRSLARSLRGRRKGPSIATPKAEPRRVPDDQASDINWLAFGRVVMYVLASIMPAGGHIVRGEGRRVRLHLLLWLVLVGLWLCFYSGIVGAMAMAAAIALHAWMITDLPREERVEGGLRRGSFMIGLCLVLWLGYTGLARAALWHFDFVPATFAVEAVGIEQGDTILVARVTDPNRQLERGTLVVARIQVITNNNYFRDTVSAFGQVIAVGGDKVSVSGRTFKVNGVALDAARYHVPQWMVGVPFDTTVPGGSYFVAAEYMTPGYVGVNAHGRVFGITPDMVRNASIIGESGIRSRAVMRWLPIQRRGFISEQ